VRQVGGTEDGKKKGGRRKRKGRKKREGGKNISHILFGFEAIVTETHVGSKTDATFAV